MDIVHHALIGGAGLMVATAHDQPLLGIAFVTGSVFPDLDVFFMAFGKRFYLRNHQGITHSLALSPLFALLLCWPLWVLLDMQWSVMMWLATWIGLVLHITLDWFNTYQIRMLSPFSSKRFSLDAVFFIDTVALSMTGAFYLSYCWFELASAALWYPIGYMAYFLFKLWLHGKVIKKLEPMFAIPSSLHPFEFYILETNDQVLIGYLYNALNGASGERVDYPVVEKCYLELAETSVVFNDMRQITRSFHIVDVEDDASGTTITAADLAVRNFGGRFARTVLKFDRKGRLVHEMANI